MKLHYVTLLAAACFAFAAPGAAAQEAARAKIDPNLPIEAQSNADSFRIERDRPNLARDYVQQPPLVPHPVANYRITKNFNQCLDCHSWTKYQQAGATKVSVNHFKDRQGRELGHISPARYFCTQCHVPQTEAADLVPNTFKRAQGLRH